MMTSRYCPANTSLPSVLHGELSLCLIDTATDPLILAVALLAGPQQKNKKLKNKDKKQNLILIVALPAGLHQLRLYRRFSTEFDSNVLPFSFLYILQLALQLCLPCIAIGTLLLHTLGLHQELCGVHILSLTTSILSWTVATILTRLERTHQLPISARHGHGPVLLIFWTLAFMQVNFRLVVVSSEPWWHQDVLSLEDKVALGLYVARSSWDHNIIIIDHIINTFCFHIQQYLSQICRYLRSFCSGPPCARSNSAATAIRSISSGSQSVKAIFASID